MGSKWVLVRVSASTKAALERVRASMMLAHDVGLLDFAPDLRDRVGLDQVILRLIEIREKHAARRKRSAARRSRKQPPATAEPQPEVTT
jgi:hypothetical protein